MNSRGYDVLVRGSASVGPVWEDRAEGRPWRRAAKGGAVRGRGGAKTRSIRSPGGALPGAGLSHRLVDRARPRGGQGLLAGCLHPAPRGGRLVRRPVEVLDLVLPDPGQLLPRSPAAPSRLASAGRLARSR